MSAEFEFGDHCPLDAYPQNMALGYDVGKISTGYLVLSSAYLIALTMSLPAEIPSYVSTVDFLIIASS